VAVSYYHHSNRRDRGLSIENCTDLMTSSGFDHIGSWQWHTREALNQRSRENILLISYENLRQSTRAEFTRILNFCGVNVTDDRADEIVSQFSIDKLRSKRISAGIDAQGANGSDVRKGSVNGWQEECPIHCQERILLKAKNEMAALGYNH